MSSLSSIDAAAGVPQINPAEIPANVANGNAAAKSAYSQGLAFEQVLVQQLTQQLSSTMFGGSSSGSSESASGSDSSSGSSGLLSGPASGFSSLVPQALTSSIMQDGGLGLADQFAEAIDPEMKR